MTPATSSIERTMLVVADNLQLYVSDVNLPILSDEELECWGNYYLANRLYARGVLFEAFIQNPLVIAEALAYVRPMPLSRGEEFYPLLPRQIDAAERIDSLNRPHRRSITRQIPADLVFLKRQAD